MSEPYLTAPHHTRVRARDKGTYIKRVREREREREKERERERERER